MRTIAILAIAALTEATRWVNEYYDYAECILDTDCVDYTTECCAHIVT